MPTSGSTQRRFRLDDDELWEEYKAACVALYGTDNRSDVIRKHVEETIAEYRRQPQKAS